MCQSGNISRETQWQIQPPNVVEICGMPPTLDCDLLIDLVAQYGVIQNMEKDLIQGQLCARFK